ncbi:MAG: hypothetical protein A49_00200 [Methyloceanibacter sp.]|nr:MAG: hypothetical protein A49_00200 [Methyloceanibacter sp.]
MRAPVAFAVALAAFLTAGPGQGAADPVSDYRRAVEASFAQWLQGLWPEAEAAGISRATFDEQLKGLALDWSLPQLEPPDPAYPGGPALPAAMKPKPQPQAEFGVPEHYFKARSLNALANGGRAQYRKSRRRSRPSRNNTAFRPRSSSPYGAARPRSAKPRFPTMPSRRSRRRPSWGGARTSSGRN